MHFDSILPTIEIAKGGKSATAFKVTMQFLNGQQPSYDLTFRDVFITPNLSNLESRFDISIKPVDNLGMTIPIVVANMNAVAGKRMSETVARRGGLTVLPQDMSLDLVAKIVSYIKERHPVYETPVLLHPSDTIMDAMNIMFKRAHGLAVIVNDKNEPVGIFSDEDGAGYDRFTELAYVMTQNPVTVPYGTPPAEIFNILHKSHVTIAPVVKNGKIAGIVSQKGLLRSEIYAPALNKKGKLLTAVAIGINGNPKEKAERLLKMGVDVLVIDTAHGYQEKTIKAIKAVRSLSYDVPIVSGNVVTAEATRELIKAGANIVKVGVGPGAMCTTRIMTAVGRPQFSAVLECATAARELGANVWADGGVRYPRDVVLALAAGASSVMVGTILAATYESVGDTLIDEAGRLYKESFGMASRRAVKARIKNIPLFEQMKKEFFEEGISTSKLYINEERPGAEDVLDYIVAGLRSAIAYSGATDLDTFYEKVVVGIQSPAGFDEGKPVDSSWERT